MQPLALSLGHALAVLNFSQVQHYIITELLFHVTKASGVVYNAYSCDGRLDLLSVWSKLYPNWCINLNLYKYQVLV